LAFLKIGMTHIFLLFHCRYNLLGKGLATMMDPVRIFKSESQ